MQKQARCVCGGCRNSQGVYVRGAETVKVCMGGAETVKIWEESRWGPPETAKIGALQKQSNNSFELRF